jgi:hypothetical protein
MRQPNGWRLAAGAAIPHLFPISHFLEKQK